MENDDAAKALRVGCSNGMKLFSKKSFIATTFRP
jgi:hypothetical protein